MERTMSRLVVAGHQHYPDGAAVEGVLGGKRAQTARRRPDEDDVALLHVATVHRDELTVGRGVHESRAGGFLPGEVLGFGKQLLPLTIASSASTTEVGLNPLSAAPGRSLCRCGRTGTSSSTMAVGDYRRRRAATSTPAPVRKRRRQVGFGRCGRAGRAAFPSWLRPVALQEAGRCSPARRSTTRPVL